MRHLLTLSLVSLVAAGLSILAQDTAAQNAILLSDQPALRADLDLMPLPVEPIFADPQNKTIAASMLDLKLEGSDFVTVLKAGQDIRMPLPEEPKN